MKPTEPTMTYAEWEKVMCSEDGEFRHVASEDRNEWYQGYVRAMDEWNK
ncbi:MAG: hypothetical protein JWM44_3677 [Bacilli bacterium]|nr:hypothetical protein [Bacilli bacterium]